MFEIPPNTDCLQKTVDYTVPSYKEVYPIWLVINCLSLSDFTDSPVNQKNTTAGLHQPKV